jgi:hypothetical protein
VLDASTRDGRAASLGARRLPGGVMTTRAGVAPTG